MWTDSVWFKDVKFKLYGKGNPIFGLDDTKKLETDLKQAKKKINGLLTDIAQQTFVIEEFEVKLNAIEKINAELELKLEKSDDKSECLEKELANALETNNESKKGTEKVINEKKDLKTRIDHLEIHPKEDKDNNMSENS